MSLYDLSNASEVVTGKDAAVVDRYAAANSYIQTNFFQCFDVELTNGPNLLTLRVTDLAGNRTVTNITFTLVTDTDPPALKLIFPQQGTEIGGETFLLKGEVDDISSTISAMVVTADSTTNFLDGMIGRRGSFWVDNVPLGEGSNFVSVTCSDTWGNTTITNIMVLKSVVRITMNPPDPAVLWRSTITANGTVSNPNYAVYVNGVGATVNADGTWSADNVPVTKGGVARFDVVGYAPGETLPGGN